MQSRVGAVVFAAAVAFGQSRLEFDAASIKPGTGTIAQRSYGNGQPGKYLAKNTPLLSMIEQAYGIRAALITGAPGWVRSDPFEVLARAEVSEEEARTTHRSAETHMFERDQLRLQALLEDRFGLRVHRESRTMPVYEVTIAKGGLKVQPPECGPKAICEAAPHEQNRAAFTVTASSVSMATLLRSLSSFSDRPFVDRTGYTAKFNATVAWYDSDSKYASSTDPAGPSLFTALRELGLKVEPTKGPVEVLVIDRVERPSAN